MNCTEFNQLDKSNYEGYIWYSNSQKPIINKFLNLGENEIPFVIEGFLYNEVSKHSISIKNFNGKYYISEFILGSFNSGQYQLSDEFIYPPLKGEWSLPTKFRELYFKKEFEEGFFTWVKVANIFTGFKK